MNNLFILAAIATAGFVGNYFGKTIGSKDAHSQGKLHGCQVLLDKITMPQLEATCKSDDKGMYVEFTNPITNQQETDRLE
jgi:hypothetical protein